jgi:hypothetical protein
LTSSAPCLTKRVFVASVNPVQMHFKSLRVVLRSVHFSGIEKPKLFFSFLQKFFFKNSCLYEEECEKIFFFFASKLPIPQYGKVENCKSRFSFFGNNTKETKRNLKEKGFIAVISKCSFPNVFIVKSVLLNYCSDNLAIHSVSLYGTKDTILK